MNTDRIWLIASVAVMAIIAAAGWFLGVSPIVSSAVAVGEQVSTITASNAASQAKVSTLKAQYASIGELQTSLDKLRESIPETANAPAFLQELNALSVAHNVTLSTVTIAAATVYVAPADSTGTATSTTTSTATPTPTPTPTPTTAPTTATTPTTPAGQFVLVPVAISVTGSFSDVRDFIGAVQGGTRLYLATSVAITDGASTTSGGGSATGTLTGDIFTLQGTSTPPAGTPAVTPTPTPTDTSTPTPTPTPTDTAIPTISPTPTDTATP